MDLCRQCVHAILPLVFSIASCASSALAARFIVGLEQRAGEVAVSTLLSQFAFVRQADDIPPRYTAKHEVSRM